MKMVIEVCFSYTDHNLSVSLIVIVTLLIKKILTLITKEAVTSRPLAGGKGQAWDIAILDWVHQRR